MWKPAPCADVAFLLDKLKFLHVSIYRSSSIQISNYPNGVLTCSATVFLTNFQLTRLANGQADRSYSCIACVQITSRSQYFPSENETASSAWWRVNSSAVLASSPGFCSLGTEGKSWSRNRWQVLWVGYSKIQFTSPPASPSPTTERGWNDLPMFSYKILSASVAEGGGTTGYKWPNALSIPPINPLPHLISPLWHCRHLAQ